MTTRPIELGLTRNPDGQSPSPWQIHVVATIIGGLGAWTAEDEREAEMAVRGEYFVTGENARNRRVKA